jgi:hypothetical protein
MLLSKTLNLTKEFYTNTLYFKIKNRLNIVPIL